MGNDGSQIPKKVVSDVILVVRRKTTELMEVTCLNPGLLAIRAWCANHYTTESRLTTSGPPATSWSSRSRSTVSSRTGTGRLPLSSERSTSPTSERKSSPGTLESCRLSGPTPWRRTVRSNWQMSAGTKVSQQVAKKTPFSRFALHCSEVSDTN